MRADYKYGSLSFLVTSYRYQVISALNFKIRKCKAEKPDGKGKNNDSHERRKTAEENE